MFKLNTEIGVSTRRVEKILSWSVTANDPMCCDVNQDADLDGSNACQDCDDSDASIRPGAAERCDGLDNDCDGMIDEDFDLDGDGFATCGTDPAIRESNNQCESQFCEKDLGICIEPCCADSTCPTGLECQMQFVQTSSNRATQARVCVNVTVPDVIQKR